MVIFKYLIEHIKYLEMLYIPHEMKQVDVSSFYTHLQSYQKVFLKNLKNWYTNVKFAKGTLSRLRHTFKDCEKSMSDMEKL